MSAINPMDAALASILEELEKRKRSATHGVNRVLSRLEVYHYMHAIRRDYVAWLQDRNAKLYSLRKDMTPEEIEQFMIWYLLPGLM